MNAEEIIELIHEKITECDQEIEMYNSYLEQENPYLANYTMLSQKMNYVINNKMCLEKLLNQINMKEDRVND